MKSIIFDMDGTVIDTLKDMTISMNHVLAANGFPERSGEEIRSFVGNGIRKLVERAVPAGTAEEMTERCYQDMLAYYQQHSLDNTAPYEGIVELMEGLKSRGYKMAIVTNKAQSAAELISAQFFGDLVDSVVGDDKKSPLKPDPYNIHRIMKDFGCAQGEAVYVGDSEVDKLTAENSDIPFFAVSWGFRDRSFLEAQGAKNISDTAAELGDKLVEYFRALQV